MWNLHGYLVKEKYKALVIQKMFLKRSMVQDAKSTAYVPKASLPIKLQYTGNEIMASTSGYLMFLLGSHV